MADGIKDPVKAQSLRFVWLRGREHGLEICLGILVAKKHDTDRDRDLGVGHILRDELLRKIGGEERKIGGFSQERCNPFEGVDELVEVGVGVALADVVCGKVNAVAGSKRGSYRRADGTFQVHVKLGLWEFRDTRAKFAIRHVKSLAGRPDTTAAGYRVR